MGAGYRLVAYGNTFALKAVFFKRRDKKRLGVFGSVGVGNAYLRPFIGEQLFVMLC